MRRTLALGAVAVAVLGSPVAPARGVTPTIGQLVDSGTPIGGDCLLDEGGETGRTVAWEIAAVIPGFQHGGNGGVVLAPPAEQLPRIGRQPNDDVFGPGYVETPAAVAAPRRDIGCEVRTFDVPPATTVGPFGPTTVPIHPAGPHVYTQYTQTVHWVLVGPDDEDPAPRPSCPLSDPDFPDPAADINPPPNPPGDSHWAIDTFCNSTATVGFNVRAPSGCPVSGDMSQWPSSPYINQYDTGERIGLPIGTGKRGGNSCGPSSLLMAMLALGGGANLPTLKETYYATVIRSGSGAVFSGPKGEVFAKSLGFDNAHVRGLTADVQEMETRILTSLQTGPILISTAFGGAKWGVTGGGHIIAIVGTTPQGGFIVQDPAGNYFGTPKPGYSGHYGPGSCGYRAVYPHFWLLAYTTKRYLLELGQRSPPRPRPASAARAAETDTVLGSAFTVYDANPGSPDAPRAFYLRDASGKRAGFVNGQIVEEIEGAAVSQTEGGWTDPAIGDEGVADPGSPPATPRSVSVSRFERRGLTLHVGAGARWALRAEAWENGKLIGADRLDGAASDDRAVTSPALSELLGSPRLVASKARARRGVVTVPLSCTAASKSNCRLSVALTAKKGRRTVTLARRAASLASGKRLTLRLKPRIRVKRATLIVSQLRKGAPATEIRRQSLRL